MLLCPLFCHAMDATTFIYTSDLPICWLPVVMSIVWGSIAIVLTSRGKIYLYTNILDVIFSGILAFFYWGLTYFLIVDGSSISQEKFYVLLSMMGVAFLLGIPGALCANPGKLWAIPLIIPAKLAVVFLMLGAFLSTFSNAQKALTQKEDRLTNTLTAGISAGLTYLLFCVVKKTTRSYQKDDTNGS